MTLMSIFLFLITHLENIFFIVKLITFIIYYFKS
jgi:hypothetical protein